MKTICIKLTSILLVMFCTIPLCAKKKNYTTLKPADFKAQIEQTANPCIIDIRPAADFAMGHIAGAVNIDSSDNPQLLSTLKQLLSNTKNIFIYCKLGKTSQPIAEWIATNGAQNVYSLKGGIMAWSKNLPVVTE